MVKTPKQFLQLLRNTLVDNVRVHSAQLLADIELNLGGEPCVARFDIVLSSHRIASLRAIGSIHGPRRSVLLVKRASCLFVPARP